MMLVRLAGPQPYLSFTWANNGCCSPGETQSPSLLPETKLLDHWGPRFTKVPPSLVPWWQGWLRPDSVYQAMPLSTLVPTGQHQDCTRSLCSGG